MVVENMVIISLPLPHTKMIQQSLNVAWEKFNQSTNSECSFPDVTNGKAKRFIGSLYERMYWLYMLYVFIAISSILAAQIDDCSYYRASCLIKVIQYVGIIIRWWNIKRIHTNTPHAMPNHFVRLLSDDKNHCTKTTTAISWALSFVATIHTHIRKDTSLSCWCVHLAKSLSNCCCKWLWIRCIFSLFCFSCSEWRMKWGWDRENKDEQKEPK